MKTKDQAQLSIIRDQIEVEGKWCTKNPNLQPWGVRNKLHFLTSSECIKNNELSKEGLAIMTDAKVEK